jgi:Tfp pilus assembly protein PilF
MNSWEWSEAETEYRAALALDPDSVMTLQLFGIFLGSQGRFDEAIPHSLRCGTRPNFRSDPVQPRQRALPCFTV